MRGMQASTSASIRKPSLAANRTARSMRTGSSRRRTSGSPMSRITPARRSSRPELKSTREKSRML